MENPNDLHDKMEQPPPPYHSLNLNPSSLKTPLSGSGIIGSGSGVIGALPSSTSTSSGSSSAPVPAITSSVVINNSNTVRLPVTSSSSSSSLASLLAAVPDIPPNFTPPNYNSVVANASIAGISSSSSTTTMMMSNSPSTLNYADAGLPFPAKVSPSDVEIGIVTPSGSSVSSHAAEIRLTILDILPEEDVIVSNILPYLPLQSLFALRGTCTRGRDIITSYLRQSTTLDLSLFGSRFTPLAFDVVTRDCRKLKKMFVANAKQWLTDDLLVPVIKRNSKLEEVDFSACSTISNKSLHVLAVIVSARLTRLVLRDCHWLSADAVINISLKCVRLRHVDLAGCWDVADDAVVTLVSRTGAHLETLSLSKIYGITDASGVEIARQCRRLKTLDLLGCWRVSDRTVQALAESCSTLKRLNIRENTNVTEASLALLRRRNVEIDVPVPGGGGRVGLQGALINPIFQQRGNLPLDFGNIPPPAFMAAVGDNNNPVRARFHRV